MKPLYLYEEVMLLALRDKEGTFLTGFIEPAVAGAILAELFIEGHINLAGKRGDLVDHRHPAGVGDPLIDECLEKITQAGRRANLARWIYRLAKIPKLRQKVARQLCDHGIVRADEDKFLFVFPRATYPEINPEPEREIMERLRQAILGTNEEAVDARTVALISLAQGTQLLEASLGSKTFHDRKKRIEEIIAGEAFGAAARDVVATGDAVAIIAAMITGLMAGTANS